VNSFPKLRDVASVHATRAVFSPSLRISALVWLLIWIPIYWRTWGTSNFLQLCDIAVILTCIGLLANSRLLLSSQAVVSPLVDLAWMVDAGSQLFFRHRLTGGTDYLFASQYSLAVRLLSLFHVALPFLLIWVLYRVGYDSRGLLLQSIVTAVAFAASRFTTPAKNMNFAFTDPFFRRQWGPPAVHIAVSVLFMILVVYLPTHLLLKRFFPAPEGVGVTSAANIDS
jgi:hypothetical protein